MVLRELKTDGPKFKALTTRPYHGVSIYYNTGLVFIDNRYTAASGRGRQVTFANSGDSGKSVHIHSLTRYFNDCTYIFVLFKWCLKPHSTISHLNHDLSCVIYQYYWSIYTDTSDLVVMFIQ